ncbi:DEKNAAC102161 [Brettanomyces naardenensis]|uniref:Transcription initiation factor TFIID subunit 4 n=1 Tax=Brettanomyces naardenensis TaxID=13370 RepID=A0A448YJY8_BRENA|nr:DEKNAAC102161 [Brettanomyces naardenensis]
MSSDRQPHEEGFQRSSSHPHLSDSPDGNNGVYKRQKTEGLEDIGSTPWLATPTLLTPGGDESDAADSNALSGASEYFTQNDLDKIMVEGNDKETREANEAKSSSNETRPSANKTTKEHGNGTTGKSNPEELSDAVAAAGVNLRDEEEAMAAGSGLSVSRRQLLPNHFLKPQQLAWFMTKAMEEQGMTAMEFDRDLINLMSSACESYMTGLVADSVVMSRHRRRGSRTKHRQSAGGSTKSEISRALKEIAVRQKVREEKRVARRVALGLEEEKKDEQAEEQTQTNITASLMMSGSRKKRYSWMQTPASGNSPLSSRGDNGIRYREAREEPGIVMRDLLSAIEGRRMGVSEAIVKGYAKLRD